MDQASDGAVSIPILFVHGAAGIAVFTGSSIMSAHDHAFSLMRHYLIITDFEKLMVMPRTPFHMLAQTLVLCGGSREWFVALWAMMLCHSPSERATTRERRRTYFLALQRTNGRSLSASQCCHSCRFASVFIGDALASRLEAFNLACIAGVRQAHIRRKAREPVGRRKELRSKSVVARWGIAVEYTRQVYVY